MSHGKKGDNIIDGRQGGHLQGIRPPHVSQVRGTYIISYNHRGVTCEAGNASDEKLQSSVS